MIFFPRLNRAGKAEIGNGESGHSRLGLGAAAGGALVANLAAGARRRAGVGRDRGRVVVRLDLAEEVDVLVVRGVFAGVRVGVEAAAARAGQHRGVVLVGGEDAVGMQRVGILDHLEQRAVARRAVDGPGGVENFVATVFGVGLREHHQLDVVRIAAEGREGLDEIIDLVSGESEAERAVGLHERGATARDERDARQRPRLFVAEERGARSEVGIDDLGHAVVEPGGELRPQLGSKVEGRRSKVRVALTFDGRLSSFDFEVDGVGDDALDALDRGEAADVRDVGGLGGPWRNGARARRDDLHQSVDHCGGAARAVGQEFFEDGVIFG